MNTTNKKTIMIVEKTTTGFSAYSLDHSIFTTGKTIPELIDNAYEAVSLFYEEENQEVTHDQIKFEIDFKQFFNIIKF